MTASPLANPAATRHMLERFGLATKHRLGQNFLVDDNVIAKILDLARLSPESRVVEVGPGIGTLTLGMLPLAGSVTSIEADRELEPVLADLAHEFPSFSYVMGDALRVSWDDVCHAGERGDKAAEQGESIVERLDAPAPEPNILVANLPYNVAATIILKYLSERPSLDAAVVMVQAEVADRICANPGSKSYGAYTAKLALFGEVTGRFEVPPTCFMPTPHVNSAVVRIERRQATAEAGCPLSADELDATAHVIEAAFAQRRKTIRNSMGASGFDKGALDEAFAAAGIAPTARAETLAPSVFICLAAALEA
ncbi:16S rRNA (adenine(1518)-N(6)/adenine(1519)-N(6))-dimethyltransferase RsmA [uncultured Parolsenella sp.]|uniref:16S rRNA (adenine(1518)-N(6)/adenine(1519)-N(6))- dimethyltransferase RsmA n=1 Tax=uncultured Parolsenella sp. TaxID=2083008 RepID=UPI0027DD1C2B|nr:16S rRNA (adenine(1518)-N(6)/adenine(1519)-N(6))-dimethyltransferase RsmA [uncultured Parolsenella sp.]